MLLFCKMFLFILCFDMTCYGVEWVQRWLANKVHDSLQGIRVEGS